MATKKKRFIAKAITLLTFIARKAMEWDAYFASYGIRFQQRQWENHDRANEEKIRTYLDENPGMLVCDEMSVIVHRDTTDSIDLTADDITELNLLQVDHYCHVSYWFLDGNKLVKREVEARKPCYINVFQRDEAVESQIAQADTSFRTTRLQAGGWWDVIVIDEATGESFQQQSLELGMKNSARTDALALLAEDVLHDKDSSARDQSPLIVASEGFGSLEHRISFATSYRESKLEDDHLNNAALDDVGIGRLFRASIQMGGVIQRRRRSRPERHYFNPFLVDVPALRKGTKAWTAKFGFHDLVHKLFCRPFPSGEMDEMQRCGGLLYAMTDEAIALTMEFLHVDSMVLSKVLPKTQALRRPEYRAWRAYNQAGWSGKFWSVEEMRELLHANTRFFLFGDTSLYTELGVDDSSEEWRDYFGWFSAFAIQDWTWNQHKTLYFGANAERFAFWWQLVEPINRQWGLGLQTMESLNASIRKGNLHAGSLAHADAVFESMFDRTLQPILESEVVLGDHLTEKHRAFLRWACNQLGVVAQFRNIPEVVQAGITLRDAVLRPQIPATEHDLQERIDRFRALYERQILCRLWQLGRFRREQARSARDAYELWPAQYIEYRDPDKTVLDAALEQLKASAMTLEDTLPGAMVLIGNESGTKFIVEQKDNRHPNKRCRQRYSGWGGGRQGTNEIGFIVVQRELSEEWREPAAKRFIRMIAEGVQHLHTFELPLNQYGAGNYRLEAFHYSLPDEEFHALWDVLRRNNKKREYRDEGKARMLTREELQAALADTNNFVGSHDIPFRRFLELTT